MKLHEALAGVQSVFLDTAPVIYHVEGNAAYQSRTDQIFSRVDAGTIEAVSSPITLAECLVHPFRSGNRDLADAFRCVLTTGMNTRCVGVDSLAEQSAELRANHNLGLADSFQLAVAFAEGCDAFLTNDRMLKRVTGIKILVLDDIEIDGS